MTLLLLAAIAAVTLPGGYRQPSFRRRTAPAVSDELVQICDLAAICLTGGLNISTSLRIAAAATAGPVAGELQRILAMARIEGLEQAMSSARGSGVRLYRAVSRAGAGGGPMLDVVRALADELWAEQAAAAIERARRLPVAMLIPLTLLILPGFLLLTIAPGVLDAFTRLSF